MNYHIYFILQVRIDHKTHSLSFGTDLGVSQKEDIPEGPYIQSMPSETIRNQVINIAQALNQAMAIIGPKESSVVSSILSHNFSTICMKRPTYLLLPTISYTRTYLKDET